MKVECSMQPHEKQQQDANAECVRHNWIKTKCKPT